MGLRLDSKCSFLLLKTFLQNILIFYSKWSFCLSGPGAEPEPFSFRFLQSFQNLCEVANKNSLFEPRVGAVGISEAPSLPKKDLLLNIAEKHDSLTWKSPPRQVHF